MKKHSPIILFGVLGAWFIIALSNVSVSAQGANEWNPLQRVPGYLDDTLPPYLVVDQNKTVHAFAGQWVGDDPPRMAIVYRRWSMAEGWSTPVDILLTDDRGQQVVVAYIDHAGIIHLVYWRNEGQVTNLYYSRAPARSADQARAWSKPELVGENALLPGSAAISGDDQGRLVIIYSSGQHGNGVYAIHSSDGGDSWSEPRPIFSTLNFNLNPYSLQLYRGQENQIHAVWNVVDSTGVDISLHYARLDITSQSWSEPLLLEERSEQKEFFGPSFPSIVDNGANVVIMYNSGNPATNEELIPGRPVQKVLISDDGGETWKVPTIPFPSHQGRSGSHALVMDSNGVAHALFIQRIEPESGSRQATIGGLWHSQLNNGRWTEPELLDLGSISGHDIQAVISQGNVLLFTMREDPGRGQLGIFYSYKVLDSMELPLTPLPTVTPQPTVAQTPSPTPVMPTSTPTPVSFVDFQQQTPPEASSDPGRLLLLGLLPAIFILAGIITVRQFIRHSE